MNPREQKEQWLRNLATARFEEGRWISGPSGSSSSLGHDSARAPNLPLQQIENIVGELLEDAIDTAEIFNFHAQGKKVLRVLPIEPDHTAVSAGFLLLLGKTQIRILQVEQNLETTLTLMRGFRVKSAPLHTFTPNADSFGNVRWQMDNHEFVGKDQITKMLIEELVRVEGEIA